jgi:hypothetical protein
LKESAFRESSGPGERWVLLVYTVPATPSRKRAAVWREVKRLGALYLRDGVCVLPDTPTARAGLEALAGRVLALDGQATLAWDARLSAATAEALRAQLAAARQREYGDALEAAMALLRHLREEGEHRSLQRAELTVLSADVGRLERWLAQIGTRDYLHDGDASHAVGALVACRAALAAQAAGAA